MPFQVVCETIPSPWCGGTLWVHICVGRRLGCRKFWSDWVSTTSTSLICSQLHLMWTLSEHVLSGQLNAMLKGCDHEIVRALNTHPKAILWKLELFFVWLWAFRFIVNAHSTGLLYTINLQYIKGCEILNHLVLCQACIFEASLTQNPVHHATLNIACHVGVLFM